MKGHFKGASVKNLLWKCATRTTPVEFAGAMEELKAYHTGCYEWLSKIPAKHWARSSFSGRAHCDILLNNICECFNGKIVDARDQPIITCLEYIREYLMKRIVIVQQVIESNEGPLTPTVNTIFEDIKKHAGGLRVTWNGGDKYQCNENWLEQFVVDMRQKVCSCRRWELNGIPCAHAVAVIWNMAENGLDVGIPEDWVHPAYNLETWKQMYSFKIQPTNGSTMWHRSNCPTKLLPPLHHTQVGRPRKKRKKSLDEQTTMVKDGKFSRTGKSITCGKCKNKGHNSKTCKGEGSSQGISSQPKGPGNGGGGKQTGSQKRKPGTRSGVTGSQTSQLSQPSQPSQASKACGGQGPARKSLRKK